MERAKNVVIAMVLTVASSACGGEDVVASCAVDIVKSCTNYSGESVTEAFVEGICAQVPQGVFSVDACSQEEVLGTCSNNLTRDGTDFVQEVVYYTGNNDTPAQLETACNINEGTWKAG